MPDVYHPAATSQCRTKTIDRAEINSVATSKSAVALGGPKGISKEEIDSIAPTQSSLRHGQARNSKGANFVGKTTNKKWLERTRPHAGDKGIKRGKTDNMPHKLPVVNIFSWNVNSIKDEIKTILLLNQIASEWPDTHLILFLESHLKENDSNETSMNHFLVRKQVLNWEY